MEIRKINFSVKTEENANERVLIGRPIVFGSMALIEDPAGSFFETVQAGALDGVNLDGIPLFIGHDVNGVPLARSPQTMRLDITSEALEMRATLPDTEQGRAVHEAVKRGDLRGMSFGFEVADDGEFFDANGVRVITRISRLLEVSVVAFPCYSEATVEARAKKNVKERSEVKMNIAEFFNKYRNADRETLEERLAELERLINESPKEDKELIMERDIIREVLKNQEEKEERSKRSQRFRYIEGTGQQTKTFGRNVLASAEYREAFFKTILGEDLDASEQAAYRAGIKRVEKRASAFSTSNHVLSVIPVQTLNEIVRQAHVKCGLLANCRAFHVPSQIRVPVGTSETEAIWHVQGTRVDSEKIEPLSVTFDGFEVMKLISLSKQAQAMSISSFESYLIDELRDCVFGAIDNALVNGTGSGQPKGLLNAITWTTANSVTVSTKEDFTYQDVVETVALLEGDYAVNAKWVMSNRTLFSMFYGLVDKQGRPIFVPDPTKQSIGKILGFEIIVDGHVPNGTVILGDFSKYLGYNMSEDIVIDISHDSSFRDGLIDLRALAIADAQVIVPEAFVKLSIAA